MFFLFSFKAHDIAETVRRIDDTTACAQSLRKECLLYDFSLNDSFKDADVLKISFELFQKGRPHEWQKFFEAILDHPNISKERQLVCDMILQIFYNLIHADTKLSPFSIGMTQMIHDLCRSKHLITVLNRLNLCTSYESMERIDTSLTQRVIDLADGHRVPVPPQIQSESIIHGAMDNFDDGPSHDTILMLFQNQSNMDNSDTVSISLNENPTRSRKLVKTLGCQNLVPCFRGKARGTIPTDFRAVTELPELIHGQYSDDLWRWSFLRYQVSTIFI